MEGEQGVGFPDLWGFYGAVWALGNCMNRDQGFGMCGFSLLQVLGYMPSGS